MTEYYRILDRRYLPDAGKIGKLVKRLNWGGVVLQVEQGDFIKEIVTVTLSIGDVEQVDETGGTK